MRKRNKSAIMGISLIELTLLALHWKLATFFLLYPTTNPIAVKNVETFVVPTANGNIEVFERRSNPALPPQGVVLNFMGNADRAENNINSDAQDWNDIPVVHLSANYPGYGKSQGPSDVRKLAPTGIAVYDFAKKKYPDLPIYVHGVSIGSTVALNIAANRPAAGVVLRSPVPLKSLILSQNGWWNLWLVALPVSLGVPSDLDAIENIRKIDPKIPVVVVQTEADTVVPLKYQQKVIDARQGAKTIVKMPKADHNDSMTALEEKEYLAAIRWIWKQSRPAP